MQFTVSALRNAEATRAGITSALAGHVSRMKPGDVFLFQYAGHGTQFPDDTGDEPDGKDEALCPVDMMSSGFIRDDDVRTILNQVPQGALAVAFIDCCHSGSITRMMRELGAEDATGSRARAIDPTPEMIEVHRRTRSRGRAVVSPLRRDLLFAACRDDQVAFETAGHGDYTTLVVPIIKKNGTSLTNVALQKLIQGAFGAGARQNPKLDCDPLAESQRVPPAMSSVRYTTMSAGEGADPPFREWAIIAYLCGDNPQLAAHIRRQVDAILAYKGSDVLPRRRAVGPARRGAARGARRRDAPGRSSRSDA